MELFSLNTEILQKYADDKMTEKRGNVRIVAVWRLAMCTNAPTAVRRWTVVDKCT